MHENPFAGQIKALQKVKNGMNAKALHRKTQFSRSQGEQTSTATMVLEEENGQGSPEPTFLHHIWFPAQQGAPAVWYRKHNWIRILLNKKQLRGEITAHECCPGLIITT